MGEVVPHRPGLLYRWWWIWTEPMRLVIRLVSERWLRRTVWSLLFSAVRLLAHGIVGNPWWFAAWLAWVWLGPTRQVLAMVILAALLVEAVLAVQWLRAGRRSSVSLWRLAWKFHRQWPRVWADCAAKTREIQSMDGGRAGESRAAAIRPVVDHPRMPWRFWLRWPIVTFRVGVAPGRTFAQFERVVSAMSANVAWVHALELDYNTDRDSFALLHVALADVLDTPGRPGWTRPTLTVVEDPTADEEGAA